MHVACADCAYSLNPGAIAWRVPACRAGGQQVGREKRKRIPPIEQIRYHHSMPRYIRAVVPGGTFFFTVALLERRRRLLTDHIDSLRDAFSATQARRPFVLDAIVILPDHLHCIWTLPPDDADFSSRWHAIKAAFSRSIPSGNDYPRVEASRANAESGNDVSGSTQYATSEISSATPITSTSTPLSTGMRDSRPMGHFPAFGDMSSVEYIRSIGVGLTKQRRSTWNELARVKVASGMAWQRVEREEPHSGVSRHLTKSCRRRDTLRSSRPTASAVAVVWQSRPKSLPSL